MTIEDVARSFTTLSGERPEQFDAMADVVLSYQRSHNPVYSRYCKALSRRQGSLPTFLPVAAFKHSRVATFPSGGEEAVFESSRTGSGSPSRHFVRDLSLYDAAAAVHFERVFGSGPFVLASYLPRYAEAGEASSLLYMVEMLQARFGADGSGSVLGDLSRLSDLADRSRREAVPLIVFGAAFGLLDVVERHTFDFPDTVLVIETGGMKTHRREVDRAELHGRLAEGFGVERSAIWSEYGMCELLSQCYTRGDARFVPPPWMRAWVVNPASPFDELEDGEIGALAVLDLANVYSASALLTEDRAVRRGKGFEILGRLSGAELRGCNFLLEHV